MLEEPVIHPAACAKALQGHLFSRLWGRVDWRVLELGLTRGHTVETLILWADALLVAALGAWLGIGAYENIRVPAINRPLVDDVLAMRTMQADFPEVHELVRSHRVRSPRLRGLAFAAIVIFETAAAVLLLLGALGFAGAGIGVWGAEAPRFIATLGTMGFILVWSGFLVGGQWVHYWATHQTAQHTHFMLAIWGVATLVFLVRG